MNNTERKNALIAECKYYKGEDKSPFPDDHDKNLLWFYERSWANDIDNIDMHQRNADELASVGLEDWAKGTTMPFTLIAYLFNRFAKNSFALKDAAQPFKEFMAKYYAI